MDKMRLTLENLSNLNPGNVVRIGDTEPIIAVVARIERVQVSFDHEVVILHFRCPDGSFFGFTVNNESRYTFEVLTDHEPVAYYGVLHGWDFESTIKP